MSSDTLRIQWKRDLPPSQWDAVIARLNGHPLQTAFWGEARRCADGIESESYAAIVDGRVVWAARVESRRVPVLGRIAWVPKGPTAAADASASECECQWLGQLRREGFMLCVVDPWEVAAGPEDADHTGRNDRPRTIWIDLAIGRDRLWGNLDKQWRYGVGKAKRHGVIVEQSRDSDDLNAFYGLCLAVSRAKGFRLPASLVLMRALMRQQPGGDASAHLFVARIGDAMGSGAFVLRSGRSVHYFWGATDRGVSESRTAEAIQWAIVEWALASGCVRYDLGGVDPEDNPGVYAFKKKMGGEEITLRGTCGHPLNIRGSLLKSVYGKLPGRRLPL